MRRRSITAQLFIYMILFSGAVFFAFPFLWLASTSMKVDRELFSSRIELLPQRPHPRVRSPYYDARQFAGIEMTRPQIDLLRPLLERRILDCTAALPQAPEERDMSAIILPGLFEELARRTPAGIWSSDAEELIRFAEQQLTMDLVVATARAAYRELGIGSLRARSESLTQIELSPPPVSRRWTLRAPGSARLLDRVEANLPYAAIEYDFSRGDRIDLEQTLELPFKAEELQRLELRIRPDDTWHGVQIMVDAAGVRYSGARTLPLVDSRWMTMTWQKPGDDDQSTKIKTWTVLRAVARGDQYNPGPSRLHVRLTITRASALEAAFEKARYNYRRVLDHLPFWRYVRVSLALVVLNIVLVLLSSSFVAYAFARLVWPGRDMMFLLLLGTMMIPSQVTMIPHFLIWKQAGAYDTLVPLWAGAALGNAFFIFLMRQFLRGIPRDLEDAARIDGCGFLRIWWHVMLPLVKPSLAAIAIFTFLGTWNDFVGPLIYIADQRLYPLAFGLYAFSVQVASNPVLTMAASLLMTVPVIAVFFLAQRYFIQGIALTGMKG